MLIEKCFTGLSLCLFLTTIASAQTKNEKAVFAGGCFWCMTLPFEKLNGVLSVVSGYTGGAGEDPNYEDYAQKGHLEAIEIVFDSQKITFTGLLEIFWRQIDPTDPNGQFCDRGRQYRPVIFYQNKNQKLLAEQSKEALAKSGRFDKPLTIELLEVSSFYKAEDYHQDYHRKNPIQYNFYRFSCGRDRYLQKIWGQTTDKKKGLKKKLTPLQYKVTQEGGTEPAYHNEYWDNHREGIYVDIVSGEPLFSSVDKYESGTGWPSFIKPLSPDNLVEKQDNSLFMKRTEIRSKQGDSHLGHVFNDGPTPEGLRYCINSAALRFVPKEDLVKEGYAKYEIIFEKKN